MLSTVPSVSSIGSNAMKMNSSIEYLGGISGDGTLVQNGKDIARATFDFEGYRTHHAGITCSGEIQAQPDVLAALFGLMDIELRTDAGRLLELRFSAKTMQPSQDFAHVDVKGDIPDQKRDWQRAS